MVVMIAEDGVMTDLAGAGVTEAPTVDQVGAVTEGGDQIWVAQAIPSSHILALVRQLLRLSAPLLLPPQVFP